MRFVCALLAVAGVVAGCHSDAPPADAKPRPTAPARSGKGGGLEALIPSAPPTTNNPSANPVVLPASGRVHSINSGLRFVVIDYTLGGMPPLQSVLPVYRNGEVVGRIRLSGPERNGFAAGDIVEGILQIDDEVRAR